MTAVRKLKLVSVEDYLAGELASQIKHEYVGGFVYAMAGARNVHNIIAVNVLGSLFVRLSGRRCQPFNSDTKIRIQSPRQVRFYYPDVSVICNENPQTDSFQDDPIAIFEVLSRDTRRLDQGEKLDAYLTIPSLCVYGMIEQESPTVIVYRRKGEGFDREIYEGLDAVIPLPEIDTELPLAEIYARVQFIAESSAGE